MKLKQKKFYNLFKKRIFEIISIIKIFKDIKILIFIL